MQIDPHTHSNCSDGTDTPLALLRLARDAGLDVIGVTDHDTFTHWSAFRAAHSTLSQARENPPAVILGTEISSRADDTSIHLLAYLSDPSRGALAKILANVTQERTLRLQQMTQKITVDYPLTWEEVVAQVPGATPGRPHLADALVKRGYFKNRSAAFAILGHDSKYYVKRSPVDAFEVVHATVADGGVPVLAHPFSTKKRTRQALLPNTVRRLADAGLAGIEVWHREHNQEGQELAARLAQELGLFMSGGSDYHGSGKPNLLGENTMPVESLQQLLATGATSLLGSLSAEALA